MHGDRFYCDICEKKFSYYRSNSLEHHKEIQQSKNYSCSICGKLFIQKGSLDRHLQSSHSVNGKTIEKIVMYHNCDHCAHKATRRSDLKRHINRRHLNPIPPQQEPNKTCDTCNKTFSSVSYRRIHVEKGRQGGQILLILYDEIFFALNELKFEILTQPNVRLSIN